MMSHVGSLTSSQRAAAAVKPCPDPTAAQISQISRLVGHAFRARLRTPLLTGRCSGPRVWMGAQSAALCGLMLVLAVKVGFTVDRYAL